MKIITEDGKQIDRLPYFPIKTAIAEQIDRMIEIGPADPLGYTGMEVDDLLPSLLEDLGWYVKRGLIDYDTALQSFRYYLVHVWENPAIQKYAADEDNEACVRTSETSTRGSRQI